MMGPSARYGALLSVDRRTYKYREGIRHLGVSWLMLPKCSCSVESGTKSKCEAQFRRPPYAMR